VKQSSHKATNTEWLHLCEVPGVEELRDRKQNDAYWGPGGGENGELLFKDMELSFKRLKEYENKCNQGKTLVRWKLQNTGEVITMKEIKEDLNNREGILCSWKFKTTLSDSYTPQSELQIQCNPV
jgi:hypothetical protein